MPKYRFTGEVAETFPSVVISDDEGTHVLVCEPGAEVELPDAVEFAHLVAIHSDAAPATAPEPAPEPPAEPQTDPVPTVPDVAGHDL